MSVRNDKFNNVIDNLILTCIAGAVICGCFAFLHLIAENAQYLHDLVNMSK